MRICDLTQSYAETGGGVRTYLNAKREHLRADTRHEYLRIVPGPEDERTERGAAVEYRVRSPRVPGSPAYRLLLRSPEVLRILAAERPDVIEVHDTYNLPWTALWHRRRHPCAVVGFCMTDLGSAYVEPAVGRLLGVGAGRVARRLADRYTRSIYRRCDATVAISEAMAEALRDDGVPRARWIPLGVDTDRFHPARRDPAVRASHGAGADDLMIVYAGRLDSEKRPDLVMDAFERLPADFPARLVLAGDGPMRDRLTERAERNGRARVIGFVQDRDELAALLASADLYASGMAFETFGLSVVEAQAAGLPVLGVRGGAMVERVEEGRTGHLVPPGDAAAMARVLEETTRDAWRGMGRAARAHVEARFSWRRTFDELLALYEAVTPASTRSGAPR